MDSRSTVLEISSRNTPNPNHANPFLSIMSLSTPTLQTLFPDLIYFDLSTDRLATAHAQSTHYSNYSAQQNARANQICLDVVLEWLSSLNLVDEPVVSAQKNLWEFLTGSVITIGETRLILIPHEDEQTEEFLIPQEWVDIPDWTADYYIPIHLDLEAQQVCLLGYVTHNTLKSSGDYDEIYRTYTIDRSHLITDLDLLWVARTLNLSERSPISNPEVIQPTETLIHQLSQPSQYSPRLEASFAQWTALMTDESLRERLYQSRLTQALRVTEATSFAVTPTMRQAVTNLTAWVQQNFEESLQQGWQTIESLLVPQSLSYGFVRNQSATDVITLAKLINLKVQLETQSIVLLIALTPNPDHTVSLLVQAHPDSRMSSLPARLSLSLQDGDTVLQSSISRTQDEFIQLRPFTCTADTQFGIGLELDEVSIIEHFTINDSILNA